MRRILLYFWLAIVPLVADAAAPPADLFDLAPLTSADLPTRISAADRKGASLPANVRTAVEFQKLLLRIYSKEPAAQWMPDMEKYASVAETDGISKALRELALCWEARGRMEEVDKALRLYYRDAIRFPDKLDDVKAQIPPDAKTDPWGETWVYKLAAPHGFADLSKQRYQLTPSRYPHFANLKEAIAAPVAAPAFKAVVRDVAGAKALELRADGQAAIVQPGGKFQDSVLGYIGDNWALFTNTERLFVVTF